MTIRDFVKLLYMSNKCFKFKIFSQKWGVVIIIPILLIRKLSLKKFLQIKIVSCRIEMKP